MKYRLTLLFFMVAVWAGFSAVLAGFNQMVCPAEPVSAFSIERCGEETYRIEFLGEEFRVALPAGAAREILARAAAMVSGVFSHAAGKIERMPFKRLLPAAGGGVQAIDERL
ncbi:MAG: hypothetical protein HPY89_03195 [Pelotomaculum sp.]|nr:hypothetical protein [Pelotomaculum sp.]